MAERQFVILIRNETTGSGAGQRVGGAGGIKNRQQAQSKQTTKEPKDNSAAALRGAIGKGLIVYGAVRKVTNEIASFAISTVEVRTGSRELQQRTSYAYNTVTSFVDSTVAGAATGAMAGGVSGAIAGAALGIAKQGASMLIDAHKTSLQLGLSESLENITRNLAAQRSTVSGSRYMNVTQM